MRANISKPKLALNFLQTASSVAILCQEHLTLNLNMFPKVILVPICLVSLRYSSSTVGVLNKPTCRL